MEDTNLYEKSPVAGSPEIISIEIVKSKEVLLSQPLLGSWGQCNEKDHNCVRTAQKPCTHHYQRIGEYYRRNYLDEIKEGLARV